MQAPIIDKLIVTNMAALSVKYGSGINGVKTAIQRLISADKSRGLNDLLIDLSDGVAMGTFGVSVLSATSANDAQLNKNAIDRVYAAFDPRPAYVLLLGATDVIPHIPLDNPMAGDGDPDVPSDLPYACDQPYSTDVQDFVRPTRVVGRLPNVDQDTASSYLMDVIRIAAAYRQRQLSDYDPVLGISAHVWQTSTSMSLSAIFGSPTGVRISPHDGPKWTPIQLSRRLAHFVNCHGASGDPNFYGQKGSSYPVAHSAKWMSSRLQKGTVMAAECCYGAELYDPALPTAMGQMGMCNTYLGQGAYAYFGSSNIAYGPPAANDQADLMCQYFLQEIRAGASSGRACLQARLRYVQNKTAVLTPMDLKTLAQFSVMSDPSLTPVKIAAPSKSAAKSLASIQTLERYDRQNRRRSLVARADGLTVRRLAPTSESPGDKGANLTRLRKLAAEHGVDSPDVIFSNAIEAPASNSKAIAEPAVGTGELATSVHTLLQRIEPPRQLPHLSVVRVVQAIEYANATDVRVFQSR